MSNSGSSDYLTAEQRANVDTYLQQRIQTALSNPDALRVGLGQHSMADVTLRKQVERTLEAKLQIKLLEAESQSRAIAGVEAQLWVERIALRRSENLAASHRRLEQQLTELRHNVTQVQRDVLNEQLSAKSGAMLHAIRPSQGALGSAPPPTDAAWSIVDSVAAVSPSLAAEASSWLGLRDDHQRKSDAGAAFVEAMIRLSSGYTARHQFPLVAARCSESARLELQDEIEREEAQKLEDSLHQDEQQQARLERSRKEREAQLQAAKDELEAAHREAFQRRRDVALTMRRLQGQERLGLPDGPQFLDPKLTQGVLQQIREALRAGDMEPIDLMSTMEGLRELQQIAGCAEQRPFTRRT